MGKRMKKIMVILCLITMGLTGCVNEEMDMEYDEESENEMSEDVPVQQLTLTDMRFDSEYSDGYAWIKLSSEEYSWMDGVVNKEGEIVAAIPTQNHAGKEYKGHSEFEEGYAFLFFDTEVDVIDTNGNVISTQQLGEDNQLAAYGAGYIVIENHIHDFDYNTYEYVFYNPQGEEVTTYTPNDGEAHEVAYMGGGVFSFSVKAEDGNETNDIYFSKTNKWVQRRIGAARDEVPVTFGKSDKRVIDCSRDNESGVLTVLDKTGEITEFRLSFKPENTDTIIAYSIIFNNYCLIIDGDSYRQGDSISVLDLNTGNQTRMNDTYFDKVKEKVNWYSEYKIYFDDNIFSIPLWGDDGEFYIGLFDVNCDLLSDPIRVDSYSKYSFSDKRLVAIQDDYDIEVYSDDGQKVYVIEGREGTNLNLDINQEYSDEVFLDIESELRDIGVYDQDGNILYTTLDTANTKIIGVDN